MLAKRLRPINLLVCLLGPLGLAVSLAADVIPKPDARQEAGEAPAKDANSPPPRDRQQAVRQGIVRCRATRTKPKQRAAALAQLAALGDEGIAAAKDLLEKELQQAEAAIRSAKKPSKLDASVEQLRKTLADLRHKPDLSKDDLHDVGLPALEELNVIYQQRAKAMAALAAKNSHVVESLRQMLTVLQLLQEHWPLNAPLPVNALLQKAQALLGDLSSPEEEQAREILAQNQAVASQFSVELRNGMDALNAARIVCGLRPLLYDAKLCAAARGHSGDMQSHDFFAHESPVEGKKTPWDRARLAGTTASGENIYKGSSVSNDALKAWFLSPGHHKNMFSESARRQGLGHEGQFWTQMFGDGEGKRKAAN